MQGVMWTLPKKLFEVLGGRLTGSVAVTFVPARRQAEGYKNATANTEVPRPADLLAHAVVLGPGGPIWAPSDVEQFVRLRVTPVPSTATDGDSHGG